MDSIDEVGKILSSLEISGGLEILEGQNHDQEDESSKLSQFESLPTELMENIFEYLNLEDKKQLRATSTTFQKFIEPQLKFHVKLSDETVEWVKSIAFPHVESIKMEGLSNEFDFNDLPTVGRLIIGFDNKEENVWNIIGHCAGSKELEHLEFIDNSIGDLSQLNEDSQSERYTILPWVKSLTVKVVGKSKLSELFSVGDAILLYRTTHFFKYIRLPAMESLSVQIEFSLAPTDISGNLVLVELYKFLNCHTLSLMNLTAQLKLCRSSPPVELNTILTTLEVESLEINQSFSNDVIPLIRASRNLKNLKLTERTRAVFTFSEDPVSVEYRNAVRDLLRNSRNLETLVLDVDAIDSLTTLQMQECATLKSFKITCEGVHEHGRIVTEPFHMPNLTSLTFEVTYTCEIVSEIIQSWLEASHGLEELTMPFIAGKTGQQAASAILAMPRMRRLILKGTGGLSASVQQFCNLILSVPCIIVESCKCAVEQGEWDFVKKNGRVVLGLPFQGRQSRWKCFQNEEFQGWQVQAEGVQGEPMLDYAMQLHGCGRQGDPGFMVPGLGAGWQVVQGHGLQLQLEDEGVGEP